MTKCEQILKIQDDLIDLGSYLIRMDVSGKAPCITFELCGETFKTKPIHDINYRLIILEIKKLLEDSSRITIQTVKRFERHIEPFINYKR